MKTLATGVEIKFDKKGNIKIIQSPYDNTRVSKPIKEDPYSLSITEELNELFKTFNPIQ